MPQVPYWYIKECEFKHECSDGSWERAKCHSWISAEDVRTAYYNHLILSSNHNKKDRFAEQRARSVNVWKEMVAEKKDRAAPDAHSRTKGRSRSPRRATSASASGAASRDYTRAAPPAAAAEPKASPVVPAVVPQPPPLRYARAPPLALAPPPGATSGSAGSASDAVTIFGSMFQQEGDIVVSSQGIRMCRDAVMRASSATRNAARYFEAGMRAFEDENKKLLDAVDCIDRILANAQPLQPDAA